VASAAIIIRGSNGGAVSASVTRQPKAVRLPSERRILDIPPGGGVVVTRHAVLRTLFEADYWLSCREPTERFRDDANIRLILPSPQSRSQVIRQCPAPELPRILAPADALPRIEAQK
jgi:hypothetical protein